MSSETQLDSWRAVAPETDDGKAFHTAIKHIATRITQNQVDFSKVQFLLADDPAPYIKQEAFNNIMTDTSQALIISKGLIASMPDENALAAVLAYHLIKEGIIPEKEEITGHKRDAPLARTIQTIDYLRDAGYSEDGMMKALEVLNKANAQHPVHTAIDTVLGNEINDSWRTFSARLELAKRTRQEGWKEQNIITQELRGFDDSGDFRNFQIDVASCRRESLVTLYLQERGYNEASLPDKVTLFLHALEELPEQYDIPSMAAWRKLADYAHNLDTELLQSGDTTLSDKLRQAFQLNARQDGVDAILYLPESKLSSQLAQFLYHSIDLAQDSFGFILPTDHIAEINWSKKLQKEHHSEDLTEKLDATALKHPLQCNKQTLPEILRDYSTEIGLLPRIRQEGDILGLVKTTGETDILLAAQYAHYALTECSILEPTIFKELVYYWQNGLQAALGTEKAPVDSSHFIHNITDIANDICSHMGQNAATKMLAALAKEAELQPELSYLLEEKLTYHKNWNTERFQPVRGMGEWLAEALTEQPQLRAALLKIMMQNKPGEQLFSMLDEQLDHIANALNDSSRVYAEQAIEATLDAMDDILEMTEALGANNISRELRIAQHEVEKVRNVIFDVLDNPEKMKEIRELGLDIYLRQATDNTLDKETLLTSLNLAHAAFWESAAEIRSTALTALLFSDGRHADSPMPDIFDEISSDMTIRQYVKQHIMPDELSDDVRIQIEAFIDSYVDNTNTHDAMVILGSALAMSSPVQGDNYTNLSEAAYQGKILAETLQSFGPLGVKFAQAIEGMPSISADMRSGMSNAKERDLTLPRWEYFHKVEARLPAEVLQDIEHFGPLLAAGSNQFTSIITYKGEESALTCLHDAVRERAAFEADMLSDALSAVKTKLADSGKGITTIEMAEGLLERAYAVMETEHNYNINEKQIKTAHQMYDNLKITINQMPVTFHVVEWKTHGKDFKIESLAQGQSFNKLRDEGIYNKEAIRNLALGIQTAETNWLVSGQIFDSDRHGANQKIEPVIDASGNVSGWQVNIFDVGALMTQRPTRKARVEFGKAVGEALHNMQDSGITFRQAMQESLLSYAQEAKANGQDAVANYLYEIPKAQLAQQDYISVFTPEEQRQNGTHIIKALVTTGRTDLSIAQGVVMEANDIIYNKAKEEISSFVKRIRNERGQEQVQQGSIAIQGGRHIDMKALSA